MAFPGHVAEPAQFRWEVHADFHVAIDHDVDARTVGVPRPVQNVRVLEQAW